MNNKNNIIYKFWLARPYAPEMPDDADGIYLYSPSQGKETPTTIDPCFKVFPAGTNIAFTTRIPFGPGLRARMERWEQQYRDGVIAGYHTPQTLEFYFPG